MVKFLAFANWLLPLLYIILLANYAAAFFLRAGTHKRTLALPPIIGFHLVFFSLQAIRLGYPPLVNAYDFLSVLAVSVAIVYCVVEYASRDRRTGMFVFLVVFLFQYTSSIFTAHTLSESSSFNLVAQSNWARLHIVPAVFAYTGFTFSAVYGLLHLAVQHNLKRHRLGLLFDRLPSLDRLGAMTWHAMLFAFVFLTVAIATGPILFRVGSSTGGSSIWDPKISTKIATGAVAWIIYLIAIVGRYWRRWPPTRISRIAVNGFLFIMAMFIISLILT